MVKEKKMNTQVNIYALSSSSDPTEYRYVGMTKLPLEERRTSHCLQARRTQETPSLVWMKSVLDDGDELVITLIAICEHYEFEMIEASYIQQMRSVGYRLTNVDNGGAGGTVVYDEFKQSIKRSKGFKAKSVSEQMAIRAGWVTQSDAWTVNMNAIYNKLKEAKHYA